MESGEAKIRLKTVRLRGVDGVIGAAALKLDWNDGCGVEIGNGLNYQRLTVRLPANTKVNFRVIPKQMFTCGGRLLHFVEEIGSQPSQRLVRLLMKVVICPYTSDYRRR